MEEDLRVVFESSNRRSCADRALVLSAAHIPYQMIEDGMSCAIIVPAGYSAAAAEQIRLYEEENPPVVPKPVKPIEYQDALPGIIGYVLIICAVSWLAGYSVFERNWFVVGRIDGELVRSGEWWRTVTALTLHSGVRHLVGNLIFGAFFGLFAGRLLGSGVAWLTIVIAAACGNAANTLLLESTHRSIGASTAVFAALGLIAGYVWRGRLMDQGSWPNRYGPIVGGLALLMFTGTGDENTDVGAHLFGFVFGFAAGMLLTVMRNLPRDGRSQAAAGGIAIALLVSAWLVGFAA
ncbi:MAG TPA: rhomboid family intramembrane serine protease [Woeseiaceae bacterium]